MGIPPQTFDVNGNVPVVIAAAPLPAAVTVLNMASDPTVYLSVEPGNKGFPLSPGSTMTWDEGQRLYVTTDDGDTARIGVVYNGGQIVDSRALAKQIVAAGLADKIAEKISLAGVPVIDRPKTLVKTSGTIPAGSPSASVIVTDLTSVPEYSSVTGRVNITSGSTSIFSLLVEQYAEPNSNTPITRSYEFVTGRTDFAIPIEGTTLSIYMRRESGTGAHDYTVEFALSYKTIKENVTSVSTPWTTLVGGNNDGSFMRSGTWADIEIPTGGRTIYYPWWTSGPFKLSWGYDTTTDASNNTAGIGVQYGPGLAMGSSTRLGRGSVGVTRTTRAIGDLNTYDGYLGRTYPTLALTNLNSTPIKINLSIVSPI